MQQETKKEENERKFTKGSVGHCKFDGWSELGARRYNDMCGLARRERQDPQAKRMEKFLLNRLQVENMATRTQCKWMMMMTMVIIARHRRLKHL
jgi:hypothetical protein